jgi:hypothetical protein
LVPGLEGRYLRVVTLADKRTIHIADHAETESHETSEGVVLSTL